MSIDRFNILCRHKLTRIYFFFQRFKISVYRRYSDFDVFHELLLQRYAYRMVPSLPPKRVLKGGMMLCHLLYAIKSQKLVMKPVNQSVIQCNHGCRLWFGWFDTQSRASASTQSADSNFALCIWLWLSHIWGHLFRFTLINLISPPLFTTVLNSMSEKEFIEGRRRALGRFLNLVARHPFFSEDELVKIFLTFSGSVGTFFSLFFQVILKYCYAIVVCICMYSIYV